MVLPLRNALIFHRPSSPGAIHNPPSTTARELRFVCELLVPAAAAAADGQLWQAEQTSMKVLLVTIYLVDVTIFEWWFPFDSEYRSVSDSPPPFHLLGHPPVSQSVTVLEYSLKNRTKVMNIPIRVFNKVEVVCGSSMLWGAAGGGGTLSGNCYTDQTKIIIISIYGERAHQKWIVKSNIGIRFVPQRRAPHLPHQQQNTILPSIYPSDPYSIYSEWWYWWSVVA